MNPLLCNGQYAPSTQQQILLQQQQLLLQEIAIKRAQVKTALPQLLSWQKNFGKAKPTSNPFKADLFKSQTNSSFNSSRHNAYNQTYSHFLAPPAAPASSGSSVSTSSSSTSSTSSIQSFPACSEQLYLPKQGG